jgi:hypothetical protein
VLLSNINYIIKDISYFSLYKVKYKFIINKLIFNLNLLVFKYKFINNKLILNLNLLVFKYKENVIYKRIKVFKLNYN